LQRKLDYKKILKWKISIIYSRQRLEPKIAIPTIAVRTHVLRQKMSERIAILHRRQSDELSVPSQELGSRVPTPLRNIHYSVFVLSRVGIGFATG
jgi:hypothetical protein